MKGTYREGHSGRLSLKKVLNALKTTYTNYPILNIVLRCYQYYNSKKEWHYYLFIHLFVDY